MLIEFNIENFRSIKEKATLSMIATKDDSLDGNLIKGVLKDDALLKSAVIYGANASGKTTVLLALNFLKLLVLNSHNHQKGQGINFTPFKLEKSCLKKPTRFNIIFLKNQIKYDFTVAFNKERIIEETLYYYPNNKKALLFKRIKDDFEFTTDEKDQSFIAKRTLENVLYLSKSTQENYEKVTPVFEWFNKELQFVGPYQPLASEEFTITLLNQDQKLKELILKALLEADIGIERIDASIKQLEKLPDNIPEHIKPLFATGPFRQTEIKTFHKGVEFEFFGEESEGTKRMFSLIGPFIDALLNGKILVIDELDTKLHHVLNLFLIHLFQDSTQNKSNAQLIFTTHNTNLLDQDIFRRDQIWFTEKNAKDGSTDLYSLTEYSPRKDKDIAKGYLAGKYGALPFIKENRIF